MYILCGHALQASNGLAVFWECSGKFLILACGFMLMLVAFLRFAMFSSIESLFWHHFDCTACAHFCFALCTQVPTKGSTKRSGMASFRIAHFTSCFLNQ